tara:strand:- start:776 stop:1330 length:555 start_codon:yes stop_codon:yes gene_type:complete
MIVFKTKNIDKEKYKDIIQRTIILNGDDGTPLSGYRAWQNFDQTWTLMIIPVTEQEEYKRYYGHLQVEVSDGIAWGVTGQKVIYMFINDSANSFIIRQNVMPLAHELLHALYIDAVGTQHIVRRYNAPEGKAGTSGSRATVIVHDNWYGSKETIKIWIRWGFIWMPITIPYIPIKKAKEIYDIN